MPELIQAPLSGEELAERYRALCEDRRYAHLPGKVELDSYGRMVMSPPASYYHGVVQMKLGQILAALGGQASAEAPIVTASGILVADATWASAQFVSHHADESPLTRAPEICIEVLSPSNSVKEIREKIGAYLAAGAEEVWVVSPESKRIELYGPAGELERSRYNVDLSGLFKT
jgi:Uma2 family endonuclease